MTDGVAPSGREHSIRFGKHSALIFDIHRPILAPHKTEAPITIRYRRNAPLTDSDHRTHAAQLVKACRRLDKLRREIDRFDPTSIRISQVATRAADPASRIEDPHPLHE